MNDELLRRREIVATTNTVGWAYIKDLAEGVVRQQERRAIDEDDDDKGAVLRRRAKAAREVVTDLLTVIESMRNADVLGPDAEEGASSATDSTDYFYEPSY